MSTTQITIHKKGHETFEFAFYRNEVAGHLDEERSDILVILDEAIQALLRQPQKIQCEQLNSSSSVHRIKIYAGGDAINQ